MAVADVVVFEVPVDAVGLLLEPHPAAQRVTNAATHAAAKAREVRDANITVFLARGGRRRN